MGVENGVFRNKCKYLSKILNICCCLHDFSYFYTLCMLLSGINWKIVVATCFQRLYGVIN